MISPDQCQGSDETSITQESDSALESFLSPHWKDLPQDTSESTDEMPTERSEKSVDSYQLQVKSHESLFENTGEEPQLQQTLTFTSSSVFQPRTRFTPRFPNNEAAIRSRELKVEQVKATNEVLVRVHSLPPANTGQIMEKMVYLPRKFPGRKTIVFDLDETLVHCVANSPGDAKVAFPMMGKVLEVGVNVRPFAKACLEEASLYFEVVVFTASLSNYADRVLDLLDPTGELIQHRLYRENCVVTDGYYIKDLRVLANCKQRDVFLVDNSVFSAAYQMENWVEVVSWYCDQGDTELLTLLRWFPRFAQALDVRTVVKDYVKSTRPVVERKKRSFVETILQLF